MTQELNDYIFAVNAIVDKGEAQAGADRLRVVISKRHGLELCLTVLLGLNNAREGIDDVPELPLFGKLEQAGRDAALFVDGGHQTVDGKSRWPDMVRVRLPQKLRVTLALHILQRLDGMAEGETTLPELCLDGNLNLRRD